jgi:toluene monooxygenase system ferredoxin subunit
MAFHKVMALDELWSGEKVGLVVAGRKILLVNLDGRIYAYEDKCAHLGVALSDGFVHGTSLICRAHRWEYDLCTGKGRNPTTACLQPFTVRVEHNNILVELT